VIFCINGNIIKQFIVLVFYTSDIIAEDSALDTVEDDDDIVNADEIKYEKIIANADEVLNYGVADFNNDGNNDVCYLDNTGLNYKWQYYQAVYCVGVLHQTDNQCIDVGCSCS
jgi:hypothetical protein